MLNLTISFEEIRKRLYSGVISDVLDSLGQTKQTMLPFIRPLDDRLVMFGRARTGLYMDVYHKAEHENPYEVEIRLLDDLAADDVVVLACNGPTNRVAPWGELLSTAARCRGAAGCVTDGLVRDTLRIREMTFPVFHGGIGPLDSSGRGKMMTMDEPVDCASVHVRSGDLVFGDADGVVVIPCEHAEQVLSIALEKAMSEDRSRDELLAGRYLHEVYAKYGVL